MVEWTWFTHVTLYIAKNYYLYFIFIIDTIEAMQRKKKKKTSKSFFICIDTKKIAGIKLIYAQ